MKKRSRKYRLRAVCCRLLFPVILVSGHANGQEKDYPVTEDTTHETEQADSGSSNPILEARDNAEDSIKKARYNYYYNKEEGGRDSFLLRKVPDSVIQRLQAQDDFWYANKDFEKKKEAAGRGSTGFWTWLARQQWYRAIAWIIVIGGFMTVLIWFLASSQVGVFRRRSKTVATADDGETAENIFEIDFNQEIDKALQTSNYRLAVRLMYLRLLKNLSEKNIIAYKQGKTNFDYLVQLNGTSYYRDFFRLTRNYEYAWYGEFAVSPGIFSAIKNEFELFDKQLG